jgi:hypothetical protein
MIKNNLFFVFKELVISTNANNRRCNIYSFLDHL